MVCISQPIQNIIIQINIDYKHFEEDYKNFLENPNIDDLRKEANIPENDGLKKNEKDSF